MIYFGKDFELNAIEKAFSIVKDKMDHSDIENSFDNLMKEKKYFEAASVAKDFSNIPEHKKVELFNGLLYEYVRPTDIGPRPALQELQNTLGYIPPKIAMASFLVELDIDIKFMSRDKDYNKNTNFPPEVLDFLKQPGMIDLFKKEMKDCFDTFNNDYKKADLGRDKLDLMTKDTGYSQIYWTRHSRHRMADKFMQLSILIDENKLSNISMKNECLAHLEKHMKVLKSDINSIFSGSIFNGRSQFEKDDLLTGVGYEGFEKIHKFGTNYQFENIVTKTNMLSNIKNMKNEFLNTSSDNKNNAKIG